MKSPEEIRAANATLDRLLVKVKRAQKHIGDLDRACEAFINSRPCIIESKSDSDARERSYYLVSVRDVPWEIIAIAGDVIQNLRTALDHLAYHLVCVGKGRVDEYPWVYFPISQSSSEFETDLARKIDGARDEAKEAIRLLKPYKGGNDAFWQLHELNRIDKHRLHVSAGSVYMGHNLTPSQRAQIAKLFSMENFPTRGAMTFAKSVRIIKAGEVLRTVAESEVEDDMKFQIDVSLDEPEIVQPESIVFALLLMHMHVVSTITNFSLLGLL